MLIPPSDDEKYVGEKEGVTHIDRENSAAAKYVHVYATAIDKVTNMVKDQEPSCPLVYRRGDEECGRLCEEQRFQRHGTSLGEGRPRRQRPTSFRICRWAYR